MLEFTEDEQQLVSLMSSEAESLSLLTTLSDLHEDILKNGICKKDVVSLEDIYPGIVTDTLPLNAFTECKSKVFIDVGCEGIVDFSVKAAKKAAKAIAKAFENLLDFMRRLWKKLFGKKMPEAKSLKPDFEDIEGLKDSEADKPVKADRKDFEAPNFRPKAPAKQKDYAEGEGLNDRSKIISRVTDAWNETFDTTIDQWVTHHIGDFNYYEGTLKAIERATQEFSAMSSSIFFVYHTALQLEADTKAGRAELRRENSKAFLDLIGDCLNTMERGAEAIDEHMQNWFPSLRTMPNFTENMEEVRDSLDINSGDDLVPFLVLSKTLKMLPKDGEYISPNPIDFVGLSNSTFNYERALEAFESLTSSYDKFDKNCKALVDNSHLFLDLDVNVDGMDSLTSGPYIRKLTAITGACRRGAAARMVVFKFTLDAFRQAEECRVTARKYLVQYPAIGEILVGK